MTDNEQPLLHQPEFTIDELRIETEADGNVTLWYDLSGPAFSTQNSMQNLFSDMAAFLEFLKQEEPAVYALYVSEEIVLESVCLDRMEAAAFDWEPHLHRFIQERVDLVATEAERIAWAGERQKRAAGPADADLNIQHNPSIEDAPGLEEAIHGFVDGINNAAVALYPNILEYNDADIAKLREILEAHGERLAIQVAALDQSVHKQG